MLYFVHIREGAWIVLDEEGLECPDLVSARAELHASARDLLAAALRDRTATNGQILELADAQGVVLERFAVRNLLH